MSFLQKYEKVTIGLIFVFIIVGGFFYNKAEYDELKKFGKITEAEVINFRYRSQALFKVVFKYEVAGNVYINEALVSKFRCDEPNNKRKGCVGKKFKVLYSSKDPNISEIDLGKYNRYKTYKPH